MRGQFAALYTGVLKLFGAGADPVAVGLLTDYVLRNPMAIGRSIGIVCPCSGPCLRAPSDRLRFLCRHARIRRRGFPACAVAGGSPRKLRTVGH